MENKFKIGQLVITKYGDVEEVISIKKNTLPFTEDEYKTAHGWHLASELKPYKLEEKFYYDVEANAMAYIDKAGDTFYSESDDVCDKYLGAMYAYVASIFGSRSDFEAWVDKIFDREYKNASTTLESTPTLPKPKYEVGQRVLLIINSREQMATVVKVDWGGSEFVYIVANEYYSSFVACESDIVRKCRACNSKKEN